MSMQKHTPDKLNKSEINNLLYEEPATHRPIKQEYSFYDAVKNGDMEFVRANCEAHTFTNPEGMGRLSKDNLTNLKYHFAITAALITRQCVDAGMELEKAYQLSDYYISTMDELKTIEDVSNLHEKMVLDYTGKMTLLRNRSAISKSIKIAIDYIYQHINERILVDDIAFEAGISVNYLSRLFAKEIGISLSDYIREKKIEKAQSLLKYTDASCVDIAIALSFSSQSHFIQVFEQYVGMTPKKYRDQ